MRSPRVLVACAVLAGLASLAGGARPAGALPPTAMVAMTASATTLPPGARILGPTDPSAVVTVDVAMQPRDPAALAAGARAVTTPGDPGYHRYLARGEFGATYGPTGTAQVSTAAWLASTGLHPGAPTGGGLLVPVRGTVSQLEAAFGTPLVDAQLGGGGVVRYATRPPEVPASLAGDIVGVLGLSTSAPRRPHVLLGPADGTAARAPGRPVPAAVAHQGPVPCADASGTGNGTWTADQLAAAYGFDSLYGQGRVGAGQTIGLYELEPYTVSDVQGYASCYGVHASVTDVPVDGGASGPQHAEAALDIEVVAGLAPSSSILVYSGPNDGGTGPIDTYARMVSDNAVRVISTSWGACEGTGGIPPAEQQAETALFQQATLQGQTIFAAAGDSGSSDCYNPGAGNFNTQLTVDDPADQPDVTGVGGTSLTSVVTNPPTETVWNGGSSFGAGGGGISADFAAPAWQQIPDAQNPFTKFTCGPSANQQCREVPDVAGSSDPTHGDAILFEGHWLPVGGTSAAAPLWAALALDGNQGCSSRMGALDQTLYAAGAGGTPPFNDVTSGNNDLFNPGGPSPRYPATAHYDLASGWGTPKGAALLATFTGAAAGCPSVTGLSASSGPATGGRSVTVSGSGFGSGVPAVDFGGAPAAIVSHSATSVSVVTPNVGTGRQVAVTVSTSGSGAGTSPSVPASTYTFVSPQVTAVTPARGPVQGGARVTVTGSDFSGATSVRFGATPASSFTVTSDGSLTAVAPPGPPGGGTVDVSVGGPDGTSPAGAADHYTYAEPGYWLTASDGGIFSFGGAGFYGSTGSLSLNRPVVGMASTPDDRGYWLVASDGGIFAFGDAGFYGSTGAFVLNRPVVGMASTPDGQGYWLVASDGGIFAFGDAGFYGSTGAFVLNRPVVGMASTPDGRGYWLVASDGGIFAFGDAGFDGSTGSLSLNRPVVGMASTPDGQGYWLVASDGGIFAFGDAGFDGSTGSLSLVRPVVGMASTLTGAGYWLVASDGGIFAFGDAAFEGSTGGTPLNQPVVGMAST